MARKPTSAERRQRLKSRALPLVGIAFVAFVMGVVQGCPGNPNKDAAGRYVDAWEKGDYESMYAELSTKSQEAIPLDRFEARYEDTAAIATLESVDADEVEGDETEAEVPIQATTLAFGMIQQPLKLTFGSDGIAFEPRLLFPGLTNDEELSRKTKMPERAPILAADGQAMAEGPSLAREHPLGDSMIDVTGEVGVPEDAELSTTTEALGFSEGEPVGTSGLELAYNARLAGTPGGTLSAVPVGSEPGTEGTVLGTGTPKAAKPLKTSIDPAIQDAAVTALAGRAGGVVAMAAKTGAVKAIAGQAYSVLQPPGSTMKIVTATAALDTAKAKMDSTYPVVTEAPADGRTIQNAHGELCGGTFVEAFANSCNSVFAPLAMEIGEEAMTETAEAYGFNKPPALFNEEATTAVDPPTPTMPTPGNYNNELGVSGIGQGTVQATPLLMASVAQGIANGGVVSPTPVAIEKDLQSDREPIRVTSKKTAAQVGELMVAVVTQGTGFAAAISEGQVAGKTGTAEVGQRAGGDPEDLIEDAWFAGFAPSDNPKLVVGVNVLDAPGDGGTIAAPIAGQVLSAGL